MPPDELRRQFDVNVVGQVAVTQAVLPRLRASRGRVVFLSSLSGRVSTPMTGAYSASKFALEALADALRMELRPWGVRVVLVEPAQTDTDLWREADGALEETVAAMSPAHRELYAGHIDGARTKMIPPLAAHGLARRRRRGDDRARADGAPPEGALRRRRRPAGAGGGRRAHADARPGRAAADGERRAAPPVIAAPASRGPMSSAGGPVRAFTDPRRTTMGRIVVTEFVSLDGVMEAPGGGEGFRHGGWSFEIDRGDEGDAFKLEETRTARRCCSAACTYEGFAEAWPSRQGEFADKFNSHAEVRRLVDARRIPSGRTRPCSRATSRRRSRG